METPASSGPLLEYYNNIITQPQPFHSPSQRQHSIVFSSHSPYKLAALIEYMNFVTVPCPSAEMTEKVYFLPKMDQPVCKNSQNSSARTNPFHKPLLEK